MHITSDGYNTDDVTPVPVVPRPPPPPTHAIPTLSEWAVFLLLILMAIVGMRQQRYVRS